MEAEAAAAGTVPGLLQLTQGWYLLHSGHHSTAPHTLNALFHTGNWTVLGKLMYSPKMYSLNTILNQG